MKIGIANDHAGVSLKKEVLEHLEMQGHEVINYGTDTLDSVNYPDYGKKVGQAIVSKEIDLGILICGTGLGISIAANKVKGVRAACVSEATSAHLAREHNHCQIVAFGARIVAGELAKDIVDSFINSTPMEGRHTQRVAMISQIEEETSLESDTVSCGIE